MRFAINKHKMVCQRRSCKSEHVLCQPATGDTSGTRSRQTASPCRIDYDSKCHDVVGPSRRGQLTGAYRARLCLPSIFLTPLRPAADNLPVSAAAGRTTQTKPEHPRLTKLNSAAQRGWRDFQSTVLYIFFILGRVATSKRRVGRVIVILTPSSPEYCRIF